MLNYLDAVSLGSFVMGVLIASSGETIPEDYQYLGVLALAVVFVVATSLNSIRRGMFNTETKQALANFILFAIDTFEARSIRSRNQEIPDSVEAIVHRLLVNGFDLSEWEIVQDENDHAILRRKPTAEVPTL